MTFRSTWWYPNYTEYGRGITKQSTWPSVQESYRRPSITHDLRYYNLPVASNSDFLHYRRPRYGMPEYRGKFRDKPHTVTNDYPNQDVAGQPPGFHGRMYYEDAPPQFMYQTERPNGPEQFRNPTAKRDELYWLERAPFLPLMTDRRVCHKMESLRTLNPPKMTAELSPGGVHYNGIAPQPR